MFAACSTNKTIAVYSTTGEALGQYKAESGVNAVLLAGKGKNTVLIAGTFGGKLRFYNVASGEEQPEVKFASGEAVNGMSLKASSLDSNFRLAVGGAASIVVLYEMQMVKSGDDETSRYHVEETLRLQHIGSVHALAQDELGSFLATGGDAKIVQIWDLSSLNSSTGEAVSERPATSFKCTTIIYSVALTAAGDMLAVGTAEGTEVYSICHDAQKPPLGIAPALLDEHRTSVCCEPLMFLELAAQQGGVAFSAHTKRLLIGGNQLATVFDCVSGATLLRKHREGRVRCVAISNDGDVVVTGGFDQIVELHHLRSGAQFSHFPTLCDVVRSSHLSAVSNRLALGCEVSGGGKILVFNAQSNELLHEWDHKKVVWCVRISPDGSFLAAAGYEMMLVIYDMRTYACLQTIKYPPLGGPAFVWSLEWAPDGTRLVVGCWNTHAYLYDVDQKVAALLKRRADAGGKETLARTALVAIAVSRCSQQCKLGLNARKAGVTPADRPSVDLSHVDVQLPPLLTESLKIKRTDRVYAVALDFYAQHLVVAGRDKRVALYLAPEEEQTESESEHDSHGGVDGINGDGNDSQPSSMQRSPPKLHVAASNVTDHFLQEEVTPVWDVAADDFVYAVAMSPDCKHVAFGGTTKSVVVLNGATGMQMLRVACPGVVWSLALLSQPQSSAKLAYGGELQMLTVIDLSTHKDVLQLPVPETIYDLCISAEALIYTNGRRATAYGKGGVHCSWQDQPSFNVITWLITSLSSSEDQLLKTMGLLLSRAPACVNATASESEMSLLHFVIQNTSSAALLELLLSVDCFIGLPKDNRGKTVLETAIDHGKWHALQLLLEFLCSPRFLRSVPASMDALSKALKLIAQKYPRDFLHFLSTVELLPEPEVMVGEDTEDVMLAGMLLAGSEKRCPQGLWHSRLQSFRHVLPESEQSLTRHGSFFEGSDANSGTATRSTGINAGIKSLRRGLSVRGYIPGNSDDDKPIQLGFSRSAHSALQACRVPFENFAGVPPDGDPSALTLVIQAVELTHDYRIFGSKILEILLDFKWSGFARKAFFFEVSWFAVHLIVITAFAILCAVKAPLPGEQIGTGFKEGDLLMIFLVFAWVFTTVRSLRLCQSILRLLCRSGLIVLDKWLVLDVINTASQLIVNILFWLQGVAGSLIVVDSGEPNGVNTGQDVGLYTVLLAAVLLTSFLRSLYFFRGWLTLGALVHTFERILIAILPLMLLLVVVLLGFAFAIWVLVQTELDTSVVPGWESPFEALFVVVNMGLYIYFDELVITLERHWTILVLYETFLLITQIVMLNMLIAIMSDSYQEVRDLGELVARFERARLTLVYEDRLLLSRRNGRDAGERLPWLSETLATCVLALWPWKKPKRDPGAPDERFPRWLHVLLPVDNSRGASGGSSKHGERKDRKEMAAIMNSLDNQEREQIRLVEMMFNSREETKHLATELKNAQLETQVQLTNLRSEVTQLRRAPVASSSTASPLKARQPGLARLVASAKGSQKSPQPALSSLLVAAKKMSDVKVEEASGLASIAEQGTDTGAKASLPERSGVNWLMQAGTKLFSAQGQQQQQSAGPPPNQHASMQPLKLDAVAAQKATEEAKTSAPAIPVAAAVPPAATAPKGGTRAAALAAQRAQKSANTAADQVPRPAELQLPPEGTFKDPGVLLSHLCAAVLEGKRPPSPRLAGRISAHIREQEYGLRQYHDDLVQAFPEMRFYAAVKAKEVNAPPKAGKAQSSSAAAAASDAVLLAAPPRQARVKLAGAIDPTATNAEEYQRTVGAFFALYWLMRLGIDGEDGFTYGVDADWTPNRRPRHQREQDAALAVAASGANSSVNTTSRKDFFELSAGQRELTFRQNTQWTKLAALMHEAGLLVWSNATARRNDSAAASSPAASSRSLSSAPGRWEVAIERTTAMLALTAVHDLMKVDPLLPTVQPEHAPYHGYNAGDKIHDHDIALGYVLDHFPEQLPSFAALPADQQRAIRFTQARIGFNHGWLVQAEAPPGALFTRFKHAIQHERATRSDLAFYFVHWITDLAGAEPTPLRGSQKLVQRFPHAVLASFISSFAIVNQLANETETAVFERYLEQRWNEIGEFGEPPTGPSAIAHMRLVVQAQERPLQESVHAAFKRLPAEDRQVLSAEMSLTGIAGQQYRRGGSLVGPAFLVYYSPAFLRTASATDAGGALRVLAEVYRQARAMWPASASSADQDKTVTIRIDQIKDRTAEAIAAGHAWGEVWLLCKRNELEAVVEMSPLEDIALGSFTSSEFYLSTRPLCLWMRQRDENGDSEYNDAPLFAELEMLKRESQQHLLRPSSATGTAFEQQKLSA